MIRPFTVSQLTAKLKGLVESEIGLVAVQGEVSGFKPSASGHCYFTLKDAQSVLSCALFRSSIQKLKFEVKDGVEICAKGRISIYPPRGTYQLIVDSVEPLGHGALQLAFEQLKEKLSKLGYFKPERKRPIPEFPQKIAVITSPTGAALQDILNVLGRRNSGVSILVVPSLVQGELAADQLVQAFHVVNKFKLADVIIVARGGGSLEDLWCFNEERVVKAVVDSAIPVISAVGHETDFTLCDFAADLRAPTPSAAAELVARNLADLLDGLEQLERRIKLLALHRVGICKNQLATLEARLVSPTQRLERLRQQFLELELRSHHALKSKMLVYRQLLDEVYTRMNTEGQKTILRRRHDLEVACGKLESLSPLKVLGRGYTLVQDLESGVLVRSVKQTKSSQEVQVSFHDGTVRAKFV